MQFVAPNIVAAMKVNIQYKMRKVIGGSLLTLNHQMDAMSTQPVGPALRHSFGVSISGCLMGVTVAYSAGALDDMGDDFYLKKPTKIQSMVFSVSCSAECSKF